jgi:hypothetical protein
MDAHHTCAFRTRGAISVELVSSHTGTREASNCVDTGLVTGVRGLDTFIGVFASCSTARHKLVAFVAEALSLVWGSESIFF